VADPNETKAESGGQAPGSNKLVTGLLALNMVAMLGVVAVLFLGQKKDAQQETLGQVVEGAAVAPAQDPVPDASGPDARFFAVGDFTANLAGPASASYVKVTVNFEISTDADEEELKQRRPQFRDKIISLLNSKRPVDLQSAEGRNYLKEEIKTVANTFVRRGRVEGVYFSAFVIN
jgi:flagellar protein FliL